MNKNEDTDLETIFKFRVPESRATFIREFIILILFLASFSLGILALGFIQYNFVCVERYSEITFMQCIRGDYTGENHRAKAR